MLQIQKDHLNMLDTIINNIIISQSVNYTI